MRLKFSLDEEKGLRMDADIGNKPYSLGMKLEGTLTETDVRYLNALIRAGITTYLLDGRKDVEEALFIHHATPEEFLKRFERKKNA
tara:strand:- start:306 stop:563 length:258 start_codon:yes stop_codon:yes gene_type:complete